MAKINTRQLQQLDTLFQNKEQELTRLINGLHINDVREDAAFRTSVKRIKTRVLLNPVTIGAPTIGEHRSQTKRVTSYEHPGGANVTTHSFPVTFPVTGSAETLRYRTGEELTTANIHAPAITNGNSFPVTVEVESMDRAQVLAKATEELEVTQTLIAQNNPQIEAWAQRTSAQIDTLTAQKRKELIAFHG